MGSHSPIQSKVALGKAEKAPTADHEVMADIPEVKVHLRTWMAVMACCLYQYANIIGLIGGGLLAQPMTSLFGQPSKAPWCSAIITLLTVSLNPPLSLAVDYWGRKWILTVGTAIGFVGCIVISRAQNLDALLGGFALIGLSAGPQSSAYAVASEIVPRKYRAAVQAALNLSISVGSIISILVAGALLRNGNLENYRIFWYIGVASFGLATLGLGFGYNPPKRELQQTLTHFERLKKLDWTGIALVTFGFLLFTLGLLWSKNPYPWSDVHVLAPFIIGCVLIVGFIVHQWVFKRDGIAHHALFENREFPLSLAIIFTEAVAFFTVNLYFVYEQTILFGLSTWDASLRFLVLSIASLVFTGLAGLFTTKTKLLREPLVAGFVLYIVATSLMTTLTPTSNSTKVWGIAVLAGMANGCVVLNVIVAVQLYTPPGMISTATGLLVATRGLGGAIGVTLNGTILANVLGAQLPAKFAAAVLPLGFPAAQLGALIGGFASGHPETLSQLPEVTPAVLAAAGMAYRDAYAVAFKGVWLLAVAFCGLTLILSMFIRNDKTLLSRHIDAPIEIEVERAQAEKEALESERSGKIEHAETVKREV